MKLKITVLSLLFFTALSSYLLKVKKDHLTFMNQKGNIIPHTKLINGFKHPCYYGVTNGDGTYAIKIKDNCGLSIK